MYGLLLEAMQQYILREYGNEMWNNVRAESNIAFHSFLAHNVYQEHILPQMAQSLARLTHRSLDSVMESFGIYFVSFVTACNYNQVLRVLGRHLNDFLNGLDNLHEYIRFSYPNLKPPSFIVTHEDEYGLILAYRTKRRGFQHYVKGQIKEVARLLYHIDIEIHIAKETIIADVICYEYEVKFDNSQFNSQQRMPFREQLQGVVPSDLFFNLFPFSLVFDEKMCILRMGTSLTNVMGDATGDSVFQHFHLVRPLIQFTWNAIHSHINNAFELVLNKKFRRAQISSPEVNGSEERLSIRSPDELAGEERLCMKGQMVFIETWKAVMFLGTPKLCNIESLLSKGMFINDLCMHDSSRDLVLAGTQQSAELKLALDQEQEKSRRLEASMMRLDEEMRRSDELLYQMIPRSVADRLRNGASAISTCQVFHDVTILFSDIVGFTNICSQITPLEVVTLLNSIYTVFDRLSELFQVYKVETIGDAYMVVSGAPNLTPNHPVHVAEMALGMTEAVKVLNDPSDSTQTLRIRIGCHSGAVVAGIVGLKMPRWCLFGDTVNTASRMESNSEPQKIHISEYTHKYLKTLPYLMQERGSIQVKGKGPMKTYWLHGHKAGEENTQIIHDLLMADRESFKSPSNGASLDEQDDKLLSDLSSEADKTSTIAQNLLRPLKPGQSLIFEHPQHVSLPANGDPPLSQSKDTRPVTNGHLSVKDSCSLDQISEEPEEVYTNITTNNVNREQCFSNDNCRESPLLNSVSPSQPSDSLKSNVCYLL